MSSEADNIDKLYKNYDVLNDAKDKISEVSFFFPIVNTHIVGLVTKETFTHVLFRVYLFNKCIFC